MLKDTMLKIAEKKEWIIEDGKVVGSLKNIYSMNLAEYIGCKLAYWHGFGVLEAWGEALRNLGLGLMQLGAVLLATIGYPLFVAWRGKQDLDRNKRQYERLNKGA